MAFEPERPDAPGWYRDPDGVYEHEAYWDGENWTGATRRRMRPPGLVSALVGGVLGGGVGISVSMYLYEQLKAGVLSDFMIQIFLLLAGLLVGPSVGATTALAIRKHDRALLTGLTAGPLVTMTMVGGYIVGIFVLSDQLEEVIGPPVLFALGIAALWMARWVTAR